MSVTGIEPKLSKVVFRDPVAYILLVLFVVPWGLVFSPEIIPEKRGQLLLLIGLVTGGLFIPLLIWRVRSTLGFFGRARTAEGEVTKLSKSRVVLMPHYSYRFQEVDYRSRCRLMRWFAPRVDVGDRLELAVDPDKPSRAVPTVYFV